MWTLWTGASPVSQEIRTVLRSDPFGRRHRMGAMGTDQGLGASASGSDAEAVGVFERVMGAAMALTLDVEVLAAVVAHAHELTVGGVHPAVRDLSQHIASDAVPGIAELDAEQQRTVAGVLTSVFRQAADLIEHPDRAPGWVHQDPVVLQATGRASMSVAGVLARVAPELDGLASRLADGGRFCDVGTGVGWLAIAAARAWPSASVVGLDVFPTALELAARNVEDSGLAGRVELRLLDVCDLAGDEFDLIWLPGPFLPEPVAIRAMRSSWSGLRPGGWVAFGTYGGPADPLSQRVADLRTVRSGGHPWTAPQVCAGLVDAGFVDVREVEREWNAPVRLVVGRRG